MGAELTKDLYALIPEINFDAGYRYFLGNLDNYTKALMATLKSIKSKLPILHSMQMTEEYEGLRTITQTLRKMLNNVGAVNLAQDTYLLETALLNEDTRKLEDGLTGYITSLIEFSEHLEEFLKNANSKSAANGEEKQSSFLNYDFTKTKESIKLSSDLLERRII